MFNVVQQHYVGKQKVKVTHQSQRKRERDQDSGLQLSDLESSV